MKGARDIILGERLEEERDGKQRGRIKGVINRD